MIGANGLAAGVQGQFQFVLPWMLLTRDHSPQTAAFAAGLVYHRFSSPPCRPASPRTTPTRVD